MNHRESASILRQRLRQSLVKGFSRAYARVGVDPERYLQQIQHRHGLVIDSFSDMRRMPLARIDPIADSAISGSMKWAGLEGAGFGLGGFVLLAPDMGVLATIVVRMIQKLSLVYGFEYSSEGESALLWLAGASAAGVDLGRDFVEKQAIERIVPRIIEKMAARMSVEMVEQWASRIVPVVSGALGAALNYYFVRQWGRRAKEHFRQRHMEAATLEFGGGASMESYRRPYA
jgi:uncharacterized protein (DUF697 family)